MEALQATIEKMKVDHEAAAKKWKLAEARCVVFVSIFLRHFSLDMQHPDLILFTFCGFLNLQIVLVDQRAHSAH